MPTEQMRFVTGKTKQKLKHFVKCASFDILLSFHRLNNKDNNHNNNINKNKTYAHS